MSSSKPNTPEHTELPHPDLDDQDEFQPAGPQEFRKRRREIFLVLVVSLMFVLLTWFEIRLFATSQQLPFVHSIFSN